MKKIDLLKRKRHSFEVRKQRLEALPQSDRDMDWLDDWSFLSTHIDRLTFLIQQEESCQASSH